jgi:hypothetical protein
VWGRHRHLWAEYLNNVGFLPSYPSVEFHFIYSLQRNKKCCLKQVINNTYLMTSAHGEIGPKTALHLLLTEQIHRSFQYWRSVASDIAMINFWWTDTDPEESTIRKSSRYDPRRIAKNSVTAFCIPIDNIPTPYIQTKLLGTCIVLVSSPSVYTNAVAITPPPLYDLSRSICNPERKSKFQHLPTRLTTTWEESHSGYWVLRYDIQMVDLW